MYLILSLYPRKDRIEAVTQKLGKLFNGGLVFLSLYGDFVTYIYGYVNGYFSYFFNGSYLFARLHILFPILNY